MMVTMGDSMGDIEKKIKMYEREIRKLKQVEILNIDDLNLTKCDPDLKESIINTVNLMNDSVNERINIMEIRIKQLKGEQL